MRFNISYSMKALNLEWNMEFKFIHDELVLNTHIPELHAAN